MRKPRDFDAELKTLEARAQQLRNRKLMQLGELVVSTGADAVSIEELAGALLGMIGTSESQRREAWRKRGAAFFHHGAKGAAAGTGGEQGGAAKGTPGDQPAQGSGGAA